MPTFAAAIVPRFVRERRSSAVPSVVEAGVIAILKQFEKLYTHMPLFTPYFSLDSSAYRVGNGGRLRCHMGAAGIGIYVMLLSHLRDCRDYRAPLDYDLLAFDLHEDADAVRRVVEEFDLFDIDRASGTFTSSALDAVRALGTSDSPSSGRTSTRTGRVRRVRTAAQAYRRSVRRLAADNALPPDVEEDIDETDAAPAEEEETSPADASRSAAEPAPAANENAPSPRTEEKRGEQNKIPHTPIVPFPPSGKGTRESHSSAPVVEEEEGASVAEVEGAVPTVADTPFAPAENLAAHPDTDASHGETGTTQATTSADDPDTETPHGETDTTQGTTSVAHPDTRTPHGETNTTQATTSADAPDTHTPHGETNTTQATTSAAHPDTRTSRGETNTTQATTSAAHPDTRTPHGETDATQATTSANAPDARTPHGETDTTQTTLNTETAKPAPLDTQPTNDARGADAEDGGTFVPPTANEVRRFAQALHHPEFDAEWFVHYYTARHWQRHNGHPVRSWQTTARYWLTHPLQVAQHLLRHRPDPGTAPAGTSPSPAGVVPTTGSTSPSSRGIGAAPAGTRPSSPASGVPLGGSLSLPAPTPLQQSRLCDLRHMVHHLFADAPAAAPAAVSTVPDAPAATSTPASSVPTSVPTPRVLSPAEAAHFIETQTLAANPAEEENRACELSRSDAEEDEPNCDELASDAEKGIEAQALAADPAEEENRACELSTTDNKEGDGNYDELPTDAKEDIEAQALSTDPAEEENRACELSTADAEEGEPNCDELDTDVEKNTDVQALSTTDNGEGIDTQAFSTTDAEEGDCNSDELDPDAEKSTDAQAISTTKGRFSTRSSHGPAPPTGDEAAATAARHHPPPHSTDPPPFPLSLNHDAPPILPLHPPAPVGLGSTLRVQSAQPPFGRALLGRIDLGNAPRPAGSRPLRPQPAEDRHNLAEDRRATPDHVPLGGGHEPEHPIDEHPSRDFAAKRYLDALLGGTHEPKTADFIEKSVVDEHPSRSDAGEHHADEPQRRDFAAKRHLDAPFGGIHEPKTADFIDNSTADDPQRRPDTGEHSADEHNAPADEHPSRSDTGEHPADEPQRRSDAGKHPADEPERRPADGEHSADGHNASADEFDAGQRLLDTAAHRRAVRAELAACCGALRHLAHCCVAF